MTTATLLSVEEYVTLTPREGAYEYDEGRVIEVPTHSLRNATIQAKVLHLLSSFIDTSGLDFVVAGPTGFWLTPSVERVPDLCLISRTKSAAMEVFHGSLRGAPEVAIEIISPSESATDLERKLDQYLTAGVLAVILIYPETRHVHVYRPSEEARRMGPGGELEIPEILPGFKLAIDELFPAAATSPQPAPGPTG